MTPTKEAMGALRMFVSIRFYKGFCSLCQAMEKVDFCEGFTRGLERILGTFDENDMVTFPFGAGFSRG